MTPPSAPEAGPDPTARPGRSAPALPVDAALPALAAALAGRGVAVLGAPPGSGKTTRVPLALLDADWLDGRRVLMLEPRRVAARAAARRLAANLGEPLGRSVGYRIRAETVGGPSTRIEVVTEGILTRMLQADPGLGPVGAVIFDEFHERAVTADLGLALCLDARAGLRPDLRVLVMSATLDPLAVAAVLDDGNGPAPVVTATGTPHPVATVYLGRPDGPVDAAVARAVARALAETDGDVLAFLPGVAEIRRTARFLAADHAATLAGRAVDVVVLHGGLGGAEQDAALAGAAPGRRKVVLATSIAETSLTIDGVRTVVDGGLVRTPRFDPSSGMTRLVTVGVSQATAEQRRGRAGRQGPGTCYRLWSAAEQAALPRAAPPEILVADLAPLALDLAEWGVADPADLRWIDPPPPGPLAAARRVLGELGALDDTARITPHGRVLARLGVHPRLAHLLVVAAEADPAAPGTAALAATVAAVLSEGDPLRGRAPDADLTARVDLVRRGGAPALAAVADRWLRLLGRPRPARGTTAGRSAAVAPADVGRLAAVAYPDRVGRRRPGQTGRFLLRSGRGAWVEGTDPLADAAWVVAAEVDGERADARIRLGAPLDPADVEADFAAAMTTAERVGWDARAGDVVAVAERRLGAILVASAPVPVGAGDAAAALLEGVAAEGLGLLPWTPAADALRDRVGFARRADPAGGWADLSDAALLADLGGWLAPWLAGRTRRSDLAGVALLDALRQRVGWERMADLDAVAPTHLVTPAGERRRLEYPPDGPPTVTLRLQELFGTDATPTVGRLAVPVLLRLTSPAGRPVQVTADLASFWATAYPAVRGELRARYPRHAWPDDPRHAVPTSRPTPRRR